MTDEVRSNKLRVTTHIDNCTLHIATPNTFQYTDPFLVSGYEYFAVYIKPSETTTLNITAEYSPFFYGEEWCDGCATGYITVVSGLSVYANRWVVLPLNPYSSIWGRLCILSSAACDIEVKIARQIAQ